MTSQSKYSHGDNELNVSTVTRRHNVHVMFVRKKIIISLASFNNLAF